MSELSVLIPARNEEWLNRTVADVLQQSKADTEVIVVLDGAWPKEPLPQHPRLQIIYCGVSIGQRAATNLAARLSQAEYICKLDAHCRVAEGWDVALIAAARELGPNVTQVPAQKNLHVYDQVCEQCGYRTDQAPNLRACTACGCERLRHEAVWEPRARPTSTNWVFDGDLHFQYASDKRQQGAYPEIMSFLGACMFVDRRHFFELGGFDESLGSWGQYAQEWACKEWLSGGRVVCNRSTWFAHFFRVGGIGFPYEIKATTQEETRRKARNYWRGNKWPQQIHPLRWLVDKFWPIEGWSEEQRAALVENLPEPRVLLPGDGTTRPEAADRPRVVVPDVEFPRVVAPSAGVIWYSDGRPSADILSASQRTVESSGLPIVSVTLQPIEWRAARSIVLPLERSYLTMFRQILAGLEALDTDVVFFAEHDVLYASDHFQFTPPRADVYYYNLNWFKVDHATGRAVTYTSKQTSQLCANRQLLIEHYRTRVARVERDGFSRRMGFEPGSHRRPERVDDVPSDVWRSSVPNIDIRHAANLTSSRWSPEQFRDKRHCQEWQEVTEVPGWGRTVGRFSELLAEVNSAVQQAVA